MVHGVVAVTVARLGVGLISEAHVSLKRLASAEVLLHKALKKQSKKTTLNNKQTQTTTTTKQQRQQQAQLGQLLTY